MSSLEHIQARLRGNRGIAALLATLAIVLVVGLISMGIAAPTTPRYQRGAVGGDFDAFQALGDWGIDESLHTPAPTPLTDDDVYVVVSKWRSGDTGQTQPTTTDTGPCTGSVRRPTAPEGKVCIYVAGGDNATDVNGYSVRPGTLGSRFGFKLAWTNEEPGDTFIDATWAYGNPQP